MSYLVECVAGPSRQLATRTTGTGIAHRTRISGRIPRFTSSHDYSVLTATSGAGRQAIRQVPSNRRFQSTSTSGPVLIDTATTVAESSLLDPLANALLSSPLPAWATIIGLTLCVRSGITLPVSLWQRRRMMREATEVRPRMKQINEQLAVSVMKDCRARGVDYEGYKKELKSKVSTNLRPHTRHWRFADVGSLLWNKRHCINVSARIRQ